MLGLAYSQSQPLNQEAQDSILYESYALQKIVKKDSAIHLLSDHLQYVKNLEVWPAYRFTSALLTTALYYNRELDPIAKIEIAHTLRDSLKKYKEAEDPHWADLNNSLGVLYQKYGLHEKMKQVLPIAIEFNKKNGYDYLLALNYSNLATAYRLQGDWITAMKYNRQAIQIWEINDRSKTFTFISKTFVNAGRASRLLKDDESAKRYYKVALELSNLSSKAHAAQGLSKIYLDHDQLDSASFFLEVAKTLKRKGEAIFPAVNAQRGYEILTKKKQYLAALEKAKEAQFIRRTTKKSYPKPTDFARGDHYIAAAWMKLNQPDSAKDYNTRALSYLFDPRSDSTQWSHILLKQDAIPLLQQRAEIMISQDSLVQALDLYEQAIQLISQLRQGRIGEQNKLLLNEASHPIVLAAMNLIYELQASKRMDIDSLYERAWQISEAYHAAVLSDEWTANIKLRQSQFPDSILQELQTLKWKISALTNQYIEAQKKGSSPAAIQAIEDDLFSIETRNRQLEEKLMNQWANYRSLNKVQHIIGELKRFPSDQLILAFFEAVSYTHLTLPTICSV